MNQATKFTRKLSPVKDVLKKEVTRKTKQTERKTYWSETQLLSSKHKCPLQATEMTCLRKVEGQQKETGSGIKQ
jgi:hypothetical protein